MYITLNKKLKMDKDTLYSLNKEIKTNIERIEKDNKIYKVNILKKNKRIDDLMDIIENR